MKVLTLMEIISAAHVAKYVVGPYTERGGIMLVGPPGAFKSTIIRHSLIEYPDTLVLSDVNVQQLGMLKDAFAGGRYTSIGFGEFEKLYERNPNTAVNIEGILRAMIEEGFDKMSFQTQQMASLKAQILVVGGITPSAYAHRFQKWIDSGFARRFLWVHYRLENPDAITEAIREWRKINFGSISFKIPANRTIPYVLTSQASRWIESLLKDQPAKQTSYTLMKKLYCVLHWRYNARRARQVFDDFAPALSREGALLYL